MTNQQTLLVLLTAMRHSVFCNKKIVRIGWLQNDVPID